MGRRPPARARIGGPRGRPRALRALALAALAAGALACGTGDARPRLVLLLTVDTLRADHVGPYGAPEGLTPNLDRLLAESVVFRRAWAPCSYTFPSVTGLLTGRHPDAIGVRSNSALLPEDVPTLAERLGAAGWRTGAVVSNWVLRRGGGLERGFDRYDDSYPSREPNRPVPERRAEATTDAALAMLDALGAAPGLGDAGRLLWVHYQDPHGPYTPPEALRERYLPAAREDPLGNPTLPLGLDSLGIGSIPDYQAVDGAREAAFYRAGYDGEVAHLDAELGRLLEGLEARGVLEGALVLFAADHGEGMGERGYWFAHGELLSEALVRVPFALRVPGREPALRDDPASLLDAVRTVLGALGRPAPEGSGRDLLAPGAEEARPALYLATVGGAVSPRLGLVAEGWKYVVTPRAEGSPRESLRHVDRPGKELRGRAPLRLAELRRRLRTLRREMPRPPGRRRVLDEEERARLRALGYVVEDAE